MGCDIHVYIEQKSHSWGLLAELNINRDYVLFAHLANERNNGTISPLFLPRGWLADMSYGARLNATYWIVNNPTEANEITPEDAKTYLDNGWTTHHNENRVYIPDWHSASWLTTSELRQVIDAYGVYNSTPPMQGFNRTAPDMCAALAMMETMETQDIECRMIFWFDN